MQGAAVVIAAFAYVLRSIEFQSLEQFLVTDRYIPNLCSVVSNSFLLSFLKNILLKFGVKRIVK